MVLPPSNDFISTQFFFYPVTVSPSSNDTSIYRGGFTTHDDERIMQNNRLRYNLISKLRIIV